MKNSTHKILGPEPEILNPNPTQPNPSNIKPKPVGFAFTLYSKALKVCKICFHRNYNNDIALK